MSKPVARFPAPEQTLYREWGTETVLFVGNGYMQKLITMKAGKAGGLQKHRLKDEGGVMLKGSMVVTYDDGTGNLVDRTVRRGDIFHFPAGCVHKARALTNCSYLEASTPHFNDRVHCEADYGIEKEEGGLPSTELDEIEVR